jgi:hypothetical protein
VAAHNFHSARGHFPACFEQRLFLEPPIYRGTSLFVMLLLFLEDGRLHDGWNYADPVQNATSGTDSRAAQVLELLLCPDDTVPANPIAKGVRVRV